MPDTANIAKSAKSQRSHLVSPFHTLQDEIERLFDTFSRRESTWPGVMTGRADPLGLRIDVSESDTELQITADLPGVREEDIDVTLENGILRITAETSSEAREEEKTWHVTERSYGRFERAVRVPSGVDAAAVKAAYKDGVLSVSVPKPAEAESSSSSRIAIRSD